MVACFQGIHLFKINSIALFIAPTMLYSNISGCVAGLEVFTTNSTASISKLLINLQKNCVLFQFVVCEVEQNKLKPFKVSF